MKNIKYLIITLAVLMVLWLLPAFVQLLAPDATRPPFVLYSFLDNDFICMESQNGVQHFHDFKGNKFTKHEADSLLPLFAFRQLLAEGRLPDTIGGIAVTPKLIQQNAFHFKTSPKQLNRPSIGLYTMFESQSGNVDLVLPPDVFRLTHNGLEFIDCKTNEILKAKSISFSRELEKHGFTFPVNLIWGNGSPRKDYDNGFLLTDQNNRLFQLKMVKGAPFVREIQLNDQIGNVQIIKVFTLEPANRALIGLFVTADHRLFAVRSNATVAHIGASNDPINDNIVNEKILKYDPDSMPVTIVGDLKHWTITLYTATDSRYYAVDANTFELVASHIVPDPAPQGWNKLKKFLLPLRLSFTSWHDQYIFPHLNDD